MTHSLAARWEVTISISQANGASKLISILKSQIGATYSHMVQREIEMKRGLALPRRAKGCSHSLLSAGQAVPEHGPSLLCRLSAFERTIAEQDLGLSSLPSFYINSLL